MALLYNNKVAYMYVRAQWWFVGARCAYVGAVHDGDARQPMHKITKKTQ